MYDIPLLLKSIALVMKHIMGVMMNTDTSPVIRLLFYFNIPHCDLSFTCHVHTHHCDLSFTCHVHTHHCDLSFTCHIHTHDCDLSFTFHKYGVEYQSSGHHETGKEELDLWSTNQRNNEQSEHEQSIERGEQQICLE